MAAKELTRDQRKAYLKKGGANCPYCGSDDIQGESVNFDGGAISQEISCNACESEWWDCYTLTGVEPMTRWCDHDQN